MTAEKVIYDQNFKFFVSDHLKNEGFSAKVEKVVRVVLYGPVISQSGCRKAGPYQLLYNRSKDDDVLLSSVQKEQTDSPTRISKTATTSGTNMTDQFSHVKISQSSTQTDSVGQTT